MAKQNGDKKRFERFGIIVKALRAARGMTVEELAGKAFGKRTQKGQISEIEAGRGSISNDRAIKIINVLARNRTEQIDMHVALALHTGNVFVADLGEDEIQIVVKKVLGIRAAKTKKTDSDEPHEGPDSEAPERSASGTA